MSSLVTPLTMVLTVSSLAYPSSTNKCRISFCCCYSYSSSRSSTYFKRFFRLISSSESKFKKWSSSSPALSFFGIILTGFVRLTGSRNEKLSRKLGRDDENWLTVYFRSSSMEIFFPLYSSLNVLEITISVECSFSTGSSTFTGYEV